MADLPLVTIQRLAKVLESYGIPYAIIGGVAVSIRAIPRYTKDVDAVLWVGESDWEKILAQVTQEGFTARAENPISFAQKNRLLLLIDEDGTQIDLSFGALPFEERMIRNAEPVEIASGCFATVATAESLVVMKAIAWRPKDIQDIRDIASINPDLDWNSVVEEFAEYAELLETPERVPALKELIRESI